MAAKKILCKFIKEISVTDPDSGGKEEVVKLIEDDLRATDITHAHRLGGLCRAADGVGRRSLGRSLQGPE